MDEKRIVTIYWKDKATGEQKIADTSAEAYGDLVIYKLQDGSGLHGLALNHEQAHNDDLWLSNLTVLIYEGELEDCRNIVKTVRDQKIDVFMYLAHAVWTAPGNKLSSEIRAEIKQFFGSLIR